MHERFRHFNDASADALGSPLAFLLAAAFAIGWLIAGPITGLSDPWQLVANTVGNIGGCIALLLIQGTQNRTTKTELIKLSELIRAIDGADDAVIDIENDPEQKLVSVRERIHGIGAEQREPAGGPPGLDRARAHDE